jgi:hypothetical protein
MRFPAARRIGRRGYFSESLQEAPMGFDPKYGTVTTEHGDIPADEPVIVFRARDLTTAKLLSCYLMLCARAGSPDRHLSLIISTLRTFTDWQQANPDKVRTPDSERSRAWLGDDWPAVGYSGAT